MIDLPAGPLQATPTFIDGGFFQRTATGLISDRIDRKGGHFMLSVTAGPFYPHIGRHWLGDLIAGKSEGVRMPFPLQWSQGSPGAVVVDGANQEGTTLVLRNATPGYVAGKGFILSIVSATGQHYVQSVKTASQAAADGSLTLTLGQQLRHKFADGAAVHLSKPMIEGYPQGDETSWEFSVNQVIPIAFTIEEAA